jgi:transposase
VRWLLDGITWRRSDPWLTSFVDCSADGPGSLLGLAPGRTGGCVRDWLAEQTTAFRDRIEVVVIDPSAPYASGIRVALPRARIAVDKWHLVALANTMVTGVRQRVTRDQYAGAAPPPTRSGGTGGCCPPAPTTSPPSSGPG